VKSVKNDERLKIRGIMQDKESVAFVSALAGLIERMLKDCEEAGLEPDECIPEELQEHAEELYERDFLEEEKHGIPKLERVIEKKLIKTKGRHLLCTHKQRIIGLVEQKTLEVNKELKVKEEKLKALTMSREEIEQKIAKLEKDRNKLFSAKTEFDRRIADNINKFEKELRKLINEEKAKGKKTLVRELKTLQSVDWDAIPSEAAFIVRSVIDEMFSKIYQKLDEKSAIVKDFKRDMQGTYENFKNELQELSISISDTFDFFPFNTIFNESMRRIEEELTAEKEKIYNELEAFKKKHSNLVKGIFRFLSFGRVDGGNRDKLLGDIKNKGVDIIERALASLLGVISSKFKNEIVEKFSEVARLIQERITATSDSLKELLSKEEELDKSAVEIRAEVEKLKGELRHLKELKKRLSNLIKVECGHV
jgi:DNA repair exonuclease SbcCD ATPase subunit